MPDATGGAGLLRHGRMCGMDTPDAPKLITETELRQLLADCVANADGDEARAKIQTLIDRYLNAVAKGIEMGVLPPWEVPDDGDGVSDL